MVLITPVFTYAYYNSINIHPQLCELSAAPKVCKQAEFQGLAAIMHKNA
jgi:hypothetical protein